MKLLIADSSEEFVSSLLPHLKESYQVMTAQDGVAAIELMKSFCPDILIIDLMLPVFDGLEVLGIGASYGIHPIILATTRQDNGFVRYKAEELGVSYILTKPCRAEAVVNRLNDVIKYTGVAGLRVPTLQENLITTLDVLGLCRTHDGYGYIMLAVDALRKDPVQQISKTLYPKIAKDLGRSKEQVERSMRSAIEKAWELRDDRIWAVYFKKDSGGAIPRPKNGEFLDMLMHLVRLWEQI